MARGSLAQGLEVGTSETEVYQTPTGITKTLIQKAEFVNTGPGMVTIDVWLTPLPSSTTSDNLKVISQKQIGVDETYLATELMSEYVNSGGKIIAEADLAGVSAWINGNQMKTEV